MPYPFRGLWFTMVVMALIGLGLHLLGVRPPVGYVLQTALTLVATVAYLVWRDARKEQGEAS